VKQKPKTTPTEREPYRGSLSSISYDLFISGLTIFSLIVAAGIVWPRNPAVDIILYWADSIICGIFAIDFLLILRRSPNKTDYFLKKGGWLDILGSIPVVPGFPWTAVFRVARLNSLRQTIKHLQGKDHITSMRNSPANTVMLTTILVGIVLITTASMLILRVERYAPNANIINGKAAFWWAVVTVTTVGYGDFAPVTNAGRILAAGLMIFGIGVFAVLTSFIASKFITSQDNTSDLIAQIQEENAFIRAELASIKDLMQQEKESQEE